MYVKLEEISCSNSYDGTEGPLHAHRIDGSRAVVTLHPHDEGISHGVHNSSRDVHDSSREFHGSSSSAALGVHAHFVNFRTDYNEVKCA